MATPGIIMTSEWVGMNGLTSYDEDGSITTAQPLSAEVESFVSDRENIVDARAETAFNRAIDAVDALGNMTISVPSIQASVDPPGAPDINTDIMPPEAPTISITLPAEPPPPDKPDFSDITAPNAPTLQDIEIADISFPDLTALPPEITTPETPEFVSALQDQVVQELKDQLAQGGTGLGEDVEEALWTRAVDRMDSELDKQLMDIDNDWASRGFDMPPAMMAAMRQEAQNEVNKRKADTNRDILTQQAQIAKEHQQFIIQQSINAVNTQAEIHRLRHENARIKTEIQRLLMEVYRAEVDAYATQVQAKRNQLDAYVAKAQPVLEKNRLLINEYTAKVQAYSSEISAETDKVRANVEYFNSRIQAFTSKSDVELREAETRARIYSSEVEAFSQEVAAEQTRIQGKVNLFSAEIQKYQVDTEMEIRAAQFQSDNNLQKKEVLINAQGQAASVGAQLAASAMAAVNTSVSWGYTGSKSESQNESLSLSYAESNSRQDSYSQTAVGTLAD